MPRKQSPDQGEEKGLREAALRNAEAILAARRRAERELLAAKDALESKTEELARQHELLEVTLGSIGDAVIATDTTGEVTFVNGAGAHLLCQTPDKIVGRPYSELCRIVDESTQEPIESPVDQALATGHRIELAAPLVLDRKLDGQVAIEGNASPIRNQQGAIAGVVMVLRDIEVRKRADAELREESRTLEILNGTGQAIAAQLDLNALVQTVTDAGTALTGARFGAFFYTVTDEQGQSLLLYTLSGAPRAAFERFGIPRNTPVFAPTFSGEGVVRSPDITKDPRYGTMQPHGGMPKGHLPVRSYLAVPVIDRTGKSIGGLFFGHPDPDVFTERAERLAVGVAAQAAVAIDNARLYDASQREVSRRIQIEAALQEADRRKDEFLATLAHELRNPLAPIRQAAHIAKAAAATEAQKRWSHDVISRQVQHMAVLLDDLLDISRVTRGTLELRTEMTELSQVIDAAVETARPTIEAKRHALSVDVPSDPVYFAADPLRLAQVVANLLTNAAKYTDPEGRIKVAASADDAELSITVSDNGIGIAQNALGRLFGMFSQVRSAQDRSEGGLGIGLALAKGLVELHGGKIVASSAGLGRGSEFTVTLPRKSLSEMLPADTTATGGDGKVRRRVLIADDNRDAAESLAELLRMDGHDVTVVGDGAQALHAFEAQQPEVALLDIGMPKLNGYEVARKVRGGSLGRAVTLIAVTGWGQDSDKTRALAAGFNHHFTKPVEPDRLARLLRSDSLAEA